MKRSRFLARITPLESCGAAQEFISAVSREHWDATHHVYAYILREGQTQRYSDDGEPQGTAGIPVLDVLRKAELTDCAVVVTRYFGGVMLGAGGLVRAYTHSAALAVQAAGVLRMAKSAVCSVACDYARYGKLNALILEGGGKVTDTVFAVDVTLHYEIPLSAAQALEEQLIDASFGSCNIVRMGERFAPFSEKQ